MDQATNEAILAKSAVFIEKLGIVFEEVAADRVVASIPVEGNTQPDGILHGGATMALVESIASFGGATVAGWPENLVVGLQQTCSFIAAAREGTVRGVGKPIHTGRTTQVWDVEVTSVETGKLIASGRVTLAVRPRRPQGGDVPASGRTDGNAGAANDDRPGSARGRDSGGESG